MEYNLESGRMSSTGGGVLHGAGSGPNSMLSNHGTMDGKGNGQMGGGPNGKMSSLSGSLYDPSIDVKIRHQLPLLNESPSLRKNRFFFQVGLCLFLSEIRQIFKKFVIFSIFDSTNILYFHYMYTLAISVYPESRYPARGAPYVWHSNSPRSHKWSGTWKLVARGKRERWNVNEIGHNKRR